MQTSQLPAPAIALRGVTKTFGDVRAVRGIDLEIGRGEVVALLGPNGAGKTTTIDIILGLTTSTSGAATVFGLDPHDAIRHGLVSAVMQTGGLLKELTVRETVTYIAALFPTARLVDEVLQTAGIAAIADRPVAKCSGGEQQRVRFAMALIPDPELLILDEPTTGMDVTSRRAFWEAIHADAQQGRTIVFATHYLEEADAFADRVVLVSHGRVVADGTPAEIRARSIRRTIRATWHGVTEQAARDIPGAAHVEIRGDQVLLRVTDSDAAARYLLTDTPAYDVLIESRGLEDAFVALTSDTTPEEATR